MRAREKAHAARVNARRAGDRHTTAGLGGRGDRSHASGDRHVLIRVGESLPSLRSWRRFSWQEKSSFTLMLMVKVATFPGCKGNWARVSSSFQLKKSPYSFSTMTATKVMTLMSQRHHETQQSPEKIHVHLKQGKMQTL